MQYLQLVIDQLCQQLPSLFSPEIEHRSFLATIVLFYGQIEAIPGGLTPVATLGRPRPARRYRAEAG